MIDNSIKLGARAIVEELEYFLNRAVNKFSYRSFFDSLPDSQANNLTLFIFAKGYPSLYILISQKGPFLLGVSVENGSGISASKKQSIRIPDEFAEFYKSFFININAIPPEKKDIKMVISVQKKPLLVPSFAVFGEKTATARLLHQENLLGVKRLSVSSLFSEEKFKFLLSSYERWNERNYRMDFKGDLVLFSIKLKKHQKNTEAENRAIAAMVKTVLSESYSNLFDMNMETDILKGIPMILTTFQIRFSRLPKWVGMIDIFLERFDNSLKEVDRLLDEIVFPQMKFLK